jgi:hypothetical protein
MPAVVGWCCRAETKRRWSVVGSMLQPAISRSNARLRKRASDGLWGSVNFARLQPTSNLLETGNGRAGGDRPYKGGQHGRGRI